MQKILGVLLITLGIVFLAAAAFSGLINLPISIYVLAKSGGGSTSYMIGRLVGAVFAAVLFFLLGRKSVKAGRSRFTSAAAQQAVQADGPASRARG